MTSTEWLDSTRTIGRSKKCYAHFDWRTDISQQKQYISNPAGVAKHGFYPLIHYIKSTVKYKKGEGKRPKNRDICYAAHIDRCIYQYYSFLLNEQYNIRVRDDGISESAVAYRTDLGENTIHFSKRVFDFIKENISAYIMIGDFTGFFDNLDHEYLKQQWCSLLGTDRLPPDHFAVYKNITAYSTIELSDLLRLNNLENTKTGRKKLNGMARVLTPNQFKENRSLIKKHTEPYGIPQGSPISGILANVYMLAVDKLVNDAARDLNGIYIRYSDDFMVVLPDNAENDVSESLKKIAGMYKQVPGLKLEESKTQFFYFESGKLTNCSKAFCENADDSKRAINFLGFTFDGQTVRIRSKTVSKYYYRTYRKARNIVKMSRYTPNGKKISCKNLYMVYSRKGSKKGNGNFLTYVDRASAEYGSKEPIKQDTKRHMQKIRRVL